ncbi:MAG: hypothetical protein ABGZ36_18765 [Actinomycetota bacterium]
MTTKPTAPEVLDLVADWAQRQVIDEATAANLRADVAGRTDLAADEPAGGFIGGAVAALVEVAGYLGAGLSIGAIAILFDVERWPDVPLALLLATIAVATTAAMWGLTARPVDGARARLAGVLTAAGAAAGAATVEVLIGDAGSCPSGVDCTAPWAHSRLAMSAAVAVAIAVVGFVRNRRALPHLVLGIGTLALSFGVAEAIHQQTYGHPMERTAGILLAIVSAVWIVGADADIMRPRWLGVLGGSAVLAGGLLSAIGNDAGPLVVAVVALALLGLAPVRDNIWLGVAGAAGAMVFVPATLIETFGLDSRTAAAIVLPIGIVLLALAVRRLRRDVLDGDDTAPGTAPPVEGPARPVEGQARPAEGSAGEDGRDGG